MLTLTCPALSQPSPVLPCPLLGIDFHCDSEMVRHVLIGCRGKLWSFRTSPTRSTGMTPLSSSLLPQTYIYHIHPPPSSHPTLLSFLCCVDLICSDFVPCRHSRGPSRDDDSSHEGTPTLTPVTLLIHLSLHSRRSLRMSSDPLSPITPSFSISLSILPTR